MKVIDQAIGREYALYHGDSIEVVPNLAEGSVGFSVYSPPFPQIFVYSDSERDLGNCEDIEAFTDHYRFLVSDLLRVTAPGRLSAVHCTDLPMQKWKDGNVGLRAFPDAIRQAHLDAGWIYHCCVTIWKCPVTEMQRTKALGLLHKQLRKDSSLSRVGLPDYLIVFRKPGENAAPIVHPDDIPVDLWQQWASPVWMDIRQGNTLNVTQAKADQDEKHVCPLQLDLIERAIRLWSNPGDTVLSPFAGIGSEGVTALKTGRKFIGVELKDSYFKQARAYLDGADRQADLLDAIASKEAAE